MKRVPGKPETQEVTLEEKDTGGKEAAPVRFSWNMKVHGVPWVVLLSGLEVG